MVCDINQLRELWNSNPKKGGCRLVLFDIAFGSHSHYTQRDIIKQFLVTHGVIKNECSVCGLDKWLGNAITLQLDHIDGDRHNNQIENLRLLCPNCHSQTETFSTRNISRLQKTRYKTDTEFIDAIKSSENARTALDKLGLQTFGGNYDRVRKIKELHSLEFCDNKKKPSMSRLLDQLCAHSIKEIGDLYGVSDNAVRKWMKSYKIPHTRNELREFIKANNMEYDVKWRIDSSNVKRGESVASVKLTEDIVRAIKSHHYDGYSVRSIAKQFNVSHSTISAILNGRSWCHVK